MSLAANADFIVDESSITGADMTGIEVSVTFGTGQTQFTETGIWQVISNTLLTTGDPLIDLNGFVGGVVTESWSFTQSGLTLGGFDDNGTAYGLWTLTNTSASGDDITGFSINGLTSDSAIAFDIDADTEGFTGSNTGQAFISDFGDNATGTYSNQVDASFSDLFFQLDVLFNSSSVVDSGASINFFADTELLSAVEVSAPATAGLLLTGLAFMSRRQKRLAVK